jgi:hypothetical protein
VNSFKTTLPLANDKYINIPFEIKWDFYGRDDSIDQYQEKVVEEIIGVPKDFEILRFSHEKWDSGLQQTNGDTIFKTQIDYNFYFFSGNPNSVTAATSNNWVTSYLDNSYSGFLPTQLYYYNKQFTKSFFKLDFYDTNTGATQTNYITVILPVQQGGVEKTSISQYLNNIDVKKPTFLLDFVGANKEGFFIYWLRKKNFINIDTFYVSAKFFDARVGEFIRMMVVPQSILPTNKKFSFNESNFFYYKVVFDYDKKTYRYYSATDTNNTNRLGDGTPIYWYEYVNPS